jgi:hypothetical protein
VLSQGLTRMTSSLDSLAACGLVMRRLQHQCPVAPGCLALSQGLTPAMSSSASFAPHGLAERARLQWQCPMAPGYLA